MGQFNGTAPVKDFFVSGNLSVGRQNGFLDVKGSILLAAPTTNATVPVDPYAFKVGAVSSSSNNSMVITKGSDELEIFKFTRGDDDTTTLFTQAPVGKTAELSLNQGSRNFTMRYEGASDTFKIGKDGVDKILVGSTVTNVR